MAKDATTHFVTLSGTGHSRVVRVGQVQNKPPGKPKAPRVPHRLLSVQEMEDRAATYEAEAASATGPRRVELLKRADMLYGAAGLQRSRDARAAAARVDYGTDAIVG
jgi:hypothetical protein